VSFHYCVNLKVEDLKIVNSQQIHMSVEDCANVLLARLSITGSQRLAPCSSSKLFFCIVVLNYFVMY
jgi:polygalacturonase